MAGAIRDNLIAAPALTTVALRAQPGRARLVWRFLWKNPLSLLGLVMVLVMFVLVIAP